MHSTEATAKRTTFIVLEIRPFANTDILGNSIFIITNNLECICVFRDETTGTFQFMEHIILRNGKPFSSDSVICVFLVKTSFYLFIV